MASITLASALANNMDGVWITLKDTLGREMTLLVTGVFNGVTAKLQTSPDGGVTPVDVPSGVFTTAAATNIQLPEIVVRISNNATGDGTTAVDAKLFW